MALTIAQLIKTPLTPQALREEKRAAGWEAATQLLDKHRKQLLPTQLRLLHNSLGTNDGAEILAAVETVIKGLNRRYG